MEEKGTPEDKGKKKKPEFVPEIVKAIREKKEELEVIEKTIEKVEESDKPKKMIVDGESKEMLVKMDKGKDGKKELPKFIVTDPNSITKKDVEEFKGKLDELVDAKEHPMTVPSIEYFRVLAQTPPEKRPKVLPIRMKRVKANRLLREFPKTKPTDPKHPVPRKKVAIVGFAETTRNEAPFNDPTFEVWGLNELYLAIPRADRWFEIHAENNIKNSFRDPKHWAWLKQAQIPIYMTKEYKDIKSCVVYPLDLMIKMFGPIFSSSIAEMMALAIYEGFSEIHLYGVDMALSKEYGAQKSGCEFFIGYALGQGIKVYIPLNSDLMRVGFQYGYDDPTEFSIKMKQKNVELLRKKQGAIQAEQQAHDGKLRIEGALELNTYYQDNYVEQMINQRYKNQ